MQNQNVDLAVNSFNFYFHVSDKIVNLHLFFGNQII